MLALLPRFVLGRVVAISSTSSEPPAFDAQPRGAATERGASFLRNAQFPDHSSSADMATKRMTKSPVQPKGPMIIVNSVPNGTAVRFLSQDAKWFERPMICRKCVQGQDQLTTNGCAAHDIIPQNGRITMKVQEEATSPTSTSNAFTENDNMNQLEKLAYLNYTNQ